MGTVLMLLCCLFGLGSAWSQPSSCYIRQSSCSSGVETELKMIRETLQVIQGRLLDSTTRSTELNTPVTTPAPEYVTTMTTTVSSTCGGPGWRRVAFLDMTDPNQDCPQGLDSTGYSIRSCGRPLQLTGRGVCSSVIFPVDGVQYNKVCGRVTAYRFGFDHAFWAYHKESQTDIDGYYVDGLSLTHGSPRMHIWTFASGLFNGTAGNYLHADARCPCDPSNGYSSPSFVGNDYFCDSLATATTYGGPPRLFPDNALWDGQSSLNTCYNNNNPPWFKKTLSTPTTNDIELRLCFIEPPSGSNIAIEHLEIYVAN